MKTAEKRKTPKIVILAPAKSLTKLANTTTCCKPGSPMASGFTEE